MKAKLICITTLNNESQKPRHSIRPDITEWAQVNGRDVISWTKKFELGLWYINNISLKTDFKICMITLRKVFKREEIDQNGQATIEEFNGDN